MKTQPSLFSITLAAAITLTFKQLTTGKKYQRPPLTLTALNGVVTDDGATVSVQFNAGQVPLRLVLWNATSTPPYSSTPPGTGAGDTWTTATAQARAEQLIGADTPSQTAAIRTLFPANVLA